MSYVDIGYDKGFYNSKNILKTSFMISSFIVQTYMHLTINKL
jgi:hypothetical protein